MFEALHCHFGVRHECYASPLNRFEGTETYCSLFHDVDRYFGSEGSFFDWQPPTKGMCVPQCFECNPPYDHMSITHCFKHIASLLTGREGGPLCFIVIVPQQDGDIRDEVPEIKPLVAHIEVVPKAKHRFLMGMQHRRTGTDNENGAWVMQNHDSTIFFLQNEVPLWPFFLRHAVVGGLGEP